MAINILGLLRNKQRKRIHISLAPKKAGGGANSFAFNFRRWIKNRPEQYSFYKNIANADIAIIIADKAEANAVKKAKAKGCFVIHRIDEYFEKEEDGYRRQKHEKIKLLNTFTDITVYQSYFVADNAQPYLQAERYTVILNGADREMFYPADRAGAYIGHVSWSSDRRKRFDLLFSLIKRYPQERFILIGNHSKTGLNFESFPNVTLIGKVRRSLMLKYYHQMKVLYLPSENDPCPNTAIEAILSGVPVCYNPRGGTKEIVKDCGVTLDNFTQLLNNCEKFRRRCLLRKDLSFNYVAEKYLNLAPQDK